MLNIFKLYAVWDGVVSWKTYFSSLPMFILLITAVVLLALVIERVIVFWRRTRVDANGVVRGVLSYLQQGDIDGALSFLGSVDSPIHNVLRVGVQNAHIDPVDVERLMYARLLNEKDRLTARLTAISVISVLAPLLGLFGTVDGLIHAFHEIAVTGSGGAEVVGEGISSSLVATWSGLIVAVIAVIAFNALNRTVDTLVSRVEAAIHELVVVLKELQHAEGSEG